MTSTPNLGPCSECEGPLKSGAPGPLCEYCDWWNRRTAVMGLDAVASVYTEEQALRQRYGLITDERGYTFGAKRPGKKPG